MGELVCYHINVLPVATDDGRSRKGIDWILLDVSQRHQCRQDHSYLHASIREASRQHKDIVCSPRVWIDDLLGRFDERFRVGLQLPFRTLQFVRASPYSASGSDRSTLDVSACQCNEIRWHGHVLNKMVDAIIAALNFLGLVFLDQPASHYR